MSPHSLGSSRVEPTDFINYYFIKFQVLSPNDFKKSQSSAPLIFKVTCYGDLSSLCGYPMPGVLDVRVYFCLFFRPGVSLPSIDSPGFV